MPGVIDGGKASGSCSVQANNPKALGVENLPTSRIRKITNNSKFDGWFHSLLLQLPPDKDLQGDCRFGDRSLVQKMDACNINNHKNK